MKVKCDKSIFSRYIVLVLGVLLPLVLISNPVLADDDVFDEDEMFDLSLEELMNIEIESTSTLTTTTRRLQPAAVTEITAEQIQASGARNLYELLDIFVPNMQWMRHHWEQDNLGLRGIHSDRDDKYMILVNGLVLNERTHFGAYTEKDLPFLSDIYKIDVVRGPGSALYGPGAVAMVINITTFSAETFQGFDVTTRVGAVEEFYTTEFRYGRKTGDGKDGIFLYGAIGKYIGADGYDAPVYSGFTYPRTDPSEWPDIYPADGTGAGDKLLPHLMPNDGGTHRDLLPIKLYGEYVVDDLKLWARYTRGGQEIVRQSRIWARSPWGSANTLTEPYGQMSSGYQQISTSLEHRYEISEQTTLSTNFGFSLTDFDQLWTKNVKQAYREDKYNARMILQHNFNENHKIAVGAEVLHNELGQKSLGWPNRDVAVIDRFSVAGLEVNPWSTDLYSIMAEYQMGVTKELTAFFGARLDDHTYTDKMFSPRMALVYAASEKDTWKLLWSRSLRSNYEDEMRAQYLTAGEDRSVPEKLDSVELRYERMHNDNLELAASAFVHYNLEVMGWSQALFSSVPVGTQRNYGFELEANYHTDRAYFNISHGYTKLYDFDLKVDGYSLITVKPNGYGDDLARWSNNLTKFTTGYKISDQWCVDSSFRAYWGFPGLKDMVDYHYDQAEYPVSDEGWKRSYRGNYYLDLGFQYKPSDNMTFRVDGYNLLGIFNKDFNKRNYNEADYRSHAAAVAFTLRYAF